MQPFPFIVPANTLSPGSFRMGTGSPVSMLSSIYVCPSVMLPSTAILSPGCATRIFPGITSATLTSISFLSDSIVTVSGRSPASFLMAEVVLLRALFSRSLPARTNAITIDEDSKYRCGSIHLRSQNSGNSRLNRLKR